ncbi:hypothetical protein ACSSVW_001718 [Pseudoalteromonas sp. MBR-15]|uniref:Uncharacterized protein n=1 Tax=Pseudoalteromonas lipolytica TaxID=570156 RepID=A0ABY1GW45_9GAMM|nr:hypothetical protein SAMN04487854_12068 [Pseudoalteromonas lipolytica]
MNDTANRKEKIGCDGQETAYLVREVGPRNDYCKIILNANVVVGDSFSKTQAA